jgi:RNA polymerase sigma factor (sigma-70 family)
LAEDGTQEAYARAYARWRRLSSETWVEGWLVTTAINYCKRRLRRERLYSPPEDTSVPSMEDAVSRDADLMEAIKALSLRQREAVVLHYIADIPVRGVADLMHLSEGTVKAHLAHARKSLRVEMEVTDV